MQVSSANKLILTLLFLFLLLSYFFSAVKATISIISNYAAFHTSNLNYLTLSFTKYFISLMYIKNKIGDNVDLCGTPYFINLGRESFPLILVTIFLFFKYD